MERGQKYMTDTAKGRFNLNRLDYNTPHSVDEVTKRNVQTIVQLEESVRANRELTDRMADVVARFCGSFTFVWVHLIWFGARQFTFHGSG